MLRQALLPVAVTLLLAAPLAAQKSYDPTGTWTITNSSNPQGGSYRGEVTIKPNGNCYTVQWTLESGEVYDGVGMVVDAGLWHVFAVAWGGSGNYGVVFYMGKGNGGFAGRWCQPDGNQGREDLGGTTDGLEGTHEILTQTSRATIVTIGPVSGSSTNFNLRWRAVQNSYQGFGTKFIEQMNQLGAIWGSPQGGIVLYNLKDVDQGKMRGVWAAMGDTSQSTEDLARR